MDASVKYDFSTDVINGLAERFSCCVGNIGAQCAIAEKNGNSADIKKFRNQIIVLEGCIEALETYDPEISTNILTRLEMMRIIQNATSICGCCCNDSSLQADITIH